MKSLITLYLLRPGISWHKGCIRKTLSLVPTAQFESLSRRFDTLVYCLHPRHSKQEDAVFTADKSIVLSMLHPIVISIPQCIRLPKHQFGSIAFTTPIRITAFPLLLVMISSDVRSSLTFDNISALWTAHMMKRVISLGDPKGSPSYPPGISCSKTYQRTSEAQSPHSLPRYADVWILTLHNSLQQCMFIEESSWVGAMTRRDPHYYARLYWNQNGAMGANADVKCRRRDSANTKSYKIIESLRK